MVDGSGTALYLLLIWTVTLTTAGYRYSSIRTLDFETAKKRCKSSGGLLSLPDQENYIKFRKFLRKESPPQDAHIWLGIAIHDAYGVKTEEPMCSEQTPQSKPGERKCTKKYKSVCVKVIGINATEEECTWKYDSTCYILNEEKLTWYHAKQSCNHQNTALADRADIQRLKHHINHVRQKRAWPERAREECGVIRHLPSRRECKRWLWRFFALGRKPPSTFNIRDTNVGRGETTPVYLYENRVVRRRRDKPSWAPTTEVLTTGPTSAAPQVTRKLPEKEPLWIDMPFYTDWKLAWLSGYPVSYTNWAADQPMLNGRNNCIVISTNSHRWSTCPCSHQNHVICQHFDRRKKGDDDEDDEDEEDARVAQGPPPHRAGDRHPPPTKEPPTLWPKWAGSKERPHDASQQNIGIYVGAAAGALAIVIIATGVGIYLCLRRRLPPKQEADNPYAMGPIPMNMYHKALPSSRSTHTYDGIGSGLYDSIVASSLSRARGTSYLEPVDHVEQPYIYNGVRRNFSADRLVPSQLGRGVPDGVYNPALPQETMRGFNNVPDSYLKYINSANDNTVNQSYLTAGNATGGKRMKENNKRKRNKKGKSVHSYLEVLGEEQRVSSTPSHSGDQMSAPAAGFGSTSSASAGSTSSSGRSRMQSDSGHSSIMDDEANIY